MYVGVAHGWQGGGNYDLSGNNIRIFVGSTAFGSRHLEHADVGHGQKAPRQRQIRKSGLNLHRQSIAPDPRLSTYFKLL